MHTTHKNLFIRFIHWLKGGGRLAVTFFCMELKTKILQSLGIGAKTYNPVDIVRSYTHAVDGHWYLSKGVYDRKAVTFDMRLDSEKARALMTCTPFYMVCDRLGAMAARGTVSVTDADGNEKASSNDLRRLLQSPNPLQTWTGFIKQVELQLSAFGYCPITLVRATAKAMPKAMWIIPAERFRMYGTGKQFSQFEMDGVIYRAVIRTTSRWEDAYTLQPYEYILIYNSSFIIGDGDKHVVDFITPSDSLSSAVSNWTAAMAATHTLLVNGGPKGILYSNPSSSDDMGNTQLTRDAEREVMDRFQRNYGLVGQEYPILVTRYPLGWLPLDYNSDQLKLPETDEHATKTICNALGVNYNLFADAKYDNQESAKKGTYQDIVIPDSNKICEALTRSLCRPGEFITMDFSDVECLQDDRKAMADTVKQAADAYGKLVSDGLITIEEARLGLSEYIDIDPAAPVNIQQND